MKTMKDILPNVRKNIQEKANEINSTGKILIQRSQKLSDEILSINFKNYTDNDFADLEIIFETNSKNYDVLDFRDYLNILSLYDPVPKKLLFNLIEYGLFSNNGIYRNYIYYSAILDNWISTSNNELEQVVKISQRSIDLKRLECAEKEKEKKRQEDYGHLIEKFGEKITLFMDKLAVIEKKINHLEELNEKKSVRKKKWWNIFSKNK